jgi:hypothetical protein
MLNFIPGGALRGMTDRFGLRLPMKMTRSWRSPRFAAHRSALLRPHPKKKGTWGDTPHAPRQLLHFPAGALDGTW